MIHIDLSVYPHHRAHPPHVIAQWHVPTWAEARDFIKVLGLKIDSDAAMEVCDNPTNEYVGVELEVLELTGTTYTAACLSIEGNEETNDPRNHEVPSALPLRS